MIKILTILFLSVSTLFAQGQLISSVTNTFNKDTIFNGSNAFTGTIDVWGEMRSTNNAGTSGQLWTSAGVGLPPFWSTIASGSGIATANGLGTNTTFKGLSETNDATGNWEYATNGVITVGASNNTTVAPIGLVLTNISGGAGQKPSPRLNFWGMSGSTPVGIGLDFVPTSTSAGDLVFSNLVSGSVVELFRLNNNGTASLRQTLTVTSGDVKIQSQGKYTTASGGSLVNVNDGQWQFVNAGNSAIAWVQIGVANVSKAVNYTVVALDSGKYFNNTGASSAVTNTLPTAVAGMQYSFYVDAAQILCVQAVGSDTIRYGATVSATAGNIFGSSVGNTLHVFSPKATVWIVDQLVGTWTGPQ